MLRVIVLAAEHPETSGEGDEKPSSVAGSNADIAASAAVSALAQAASEQFSPELTTKIFELLCDESVSCFCIDTVFTVRRSA